MDDVGFDAAQQTTKILFVADLACPWCRIALHTLEPLLARLGLALHWHPFLLNPNLPQDGVPRALYLERACGSSETARRVQARIQERGRALGLAFAFERIERQPNTTLAHALVLAAPYEHRFALARRLFAAFFEDGADLGDPRTLLSLAQASGMTIEAARGALEDEAWARVHSAHREAERIGIDGVPALVLPGVGMLAGAQPPEVFEGFLELAVLFAGRGGTR